MINRFQPGCQHVADTLETPPSHSTRVSPQRLGAASTSALAAAEGAFAPTPILTIKRKITDESARVIVAGNFQEHKELPSILSQLTLFLSGRNWSFAFERNEAQHERTLSGSTWGCQGKRGGRGPAMSPQPSERASRVVCTGLLVYGLFLHGPQTSA